MSARRRRRPPIAVGLVAVLAAAPATAAGQTVPAGTPPPADAAAVRTVALDAAAGWRDTLEAHRTPQLPAPGDTESAILLLDGARAAAAAPADRAAAARAVTADQQALDPVLSSLGATVTFRSRVLVNAIGVRLPAGRLESLAALPEVEAVVPVAFLAPAQAAGSPAPAPLPAPRARPPARRAGGGDPAHIALIDAGIDASHPWLGGGIGPTFPVIGGYDLIDRDPDPSYDPADPAAEGHGTQMASLVLRSAALAGLPPARTPRLLAYRVVAREAVGGRLRPLARTDRVLAALDRAVDPDGDGDPSDGAEVILMGLAAGFDGGGIDPVAQALAAADRIGATVVVPAGNDGPTYARPGSVGGPAAAPSAIAAGGLSAPASPRTADLEALLGPAVARLGPLPLMGPEPGDAALPVTLLRAPDGLATGDAPENYRGPGAGTVRGALVVVARGGGTIAEKAAQAAAAGAAALAVWDVTGPAGFPGVPGDGGLPIPVVGIGAQQGQALAGLAADQPDLRVALRPGPAADAPRSVASFSSWGPTADGRQKPDLVAPAVAREAAWPGRGPDGAPRQAALTGTSAAAAEVAARALRLRIDRPELGPRAVHSVLVQSAVPVEGISVRRQGAGALQPPGAPALRIDPPLVAAHPGRRAGAGAVARIVLGDLSGRAGRFVVVLRTGAREVPLGAARLRPGGRATLRLRLPPGAAQGQLVVRRAGGGEVAARAVVLPSRPASTPAEALGIPQIRADSGLAEVQVRVGMLRRDDSRVRSVRLHGVRLDLLPGDGGPPLPVAGTKQASAWPAGTYRFLVARRLASGVEVIPGTYRVRVTGIGPDGTVLQRESGPFALD